MKFSEVMIYFDYKMVNIAKALNMKPQSITTWHKKNQIPYPRQCELEILTKGVLKADKDD